MPTPTKPTKEPHWVTCTNKHNHLEPVEELEDADGILTFCCKACKPKLPRSVVCTTKRNHLEEVEILKDADGIFLTFCCNACKEDKLSNYRHDIQTRSSQGECDWGLDEDGDY